MQLPRPVEVEDGTEGARVAIEEVLILDEAVVVAELHDGVVVVALPQAAQPRVRQPLQRPPEHFVLHSPYIENHSSVERPALEDHALVGDEGGNGDGLHLPLVSSGLPSDGPLAPLVVAQYDHLIIWVT